MAILNNLIRKTLTADGGSDSDTFAAHGTCQQILVTPATSTTQFDVTLTDSGSVVVFKRTNYVGTLNELVNLPMSGNYTINLDNATVNEAHTVLIAIRNA